MTLHEPNPDQLEFVAELLRAEAPRIAARAARDLTTLHPDVARRWGPVGGQADLAWTDALHQRLNDLATAVGAGRPELFGLQLAWAQQAFAARGLPADDLTRSIHALRGAVLDALPETDHDLVTAPFALAIATLSRPVGEPPAEVSSKTPHGRRAAEYLAAVLNGDRRAACAVILDAVRGGRLSAPDAYTQVLGPALREMGRMWHLGEVNVAEEHFATATTLIAMAQLLELWEHRPPNGLTVVAATVAGNSHEIGARMVADFFEADGWRTIYLGPNVPAHDLASATAEYRAHIVCLSVTLPSQLLALRDSARALRATSPDARLIAGGPGLFDLPDLATDNGAHAFARSPDDALRAAATLLAGRG